MAERLESEKSELVLGINSFNKPAEVAGVDAWVKLVTNLIFMNKGTYPSDPDMGCEIQQYEFSFIDEVKDEIENLIENQVRTYLDDIPFESVTVSKTVTESGKPILLIILEFSYNKNSNSVVVAATKSNNLINFEVVA